MGKPGSPLRAARLAIALGLAVACAACGKEGPELHPVHGQMTFEGQPPVGATVVFQPKASTGAEVLMPSGVVQADGKFSLQTHPHGAGAPAGDYSVLVTWYPENARELDNPANKLPAKYSDQAAPLLTATVKPGTNELAPMQLTK
jgi:hypothetical protein